MAIGRGARTPGTCARPPTERGAASQEEGRVRQGARLLVNYDNWSRQVMGWDAVHAFLAFVCQTGKKIGIEKKEHFGLFCGRTGLWKPILSNTFKYGILANAALGLLLNTVQVCI